MPKSKALWYKCKGLNTGVDMKWTTAVFRVLENRISKQTVAFKLTFWCNMRLWNWTFPQFWSFGMQIFQEFVISDECRILSNWNILKWGVLGNGQEGVKRGSPGRHVPHIQGNIQYRTFSRPCSCLRKPLGQVYKDKLGRACLVWAPNWLFFLPQSSQKTNVTTPLTCSLNVTKSLKTGF